MGPGEANSRARGCLWLIALAGAWWVIVFTVAYVAGLTWGGAIAGLIAATVVIGVIVFKRRGRRVPPEARGKCPVCGGGVVWADGRCSHCGTALDPVKRQRTESSR